MLTRSVDVHGLVTVERVERVVQMLGEQVGVVELGVDLLHRHLPESPHVRR